MKGLTKRTGSAAALAVLLALLAGCGGENEEIGRAHV